MAIAFAIFGVSYAAFSIWLTVRIFNKRERWAKWTLATMIVGLPLLYVLSFGPAYWITRQDDPKFRRFGGHQQPSQAMLLYCPLGNAMNNPGSPAGRALLWWITIGLRKGQWAVVPTGTDRWSAYECQ